MQSHPKFKLGEEVVREVASPPTYGKLHDLTCSCVLFQLFFQGIYIKQGTVCHCISLRKELKMLHTVEYFQQNSRCLEIDETL